MVEINTSATTQTGKSVNMIPQVRVSAMDCLISSFNFVVTLNEFTFGFQSVSGISVEKPFEHIAEGGVNDHEIMVGKPAYDHATLTFKRGMLVRSPTIIDKVARAAAAAIPNAAARKQALLQLNSLNPQEALETGPAYGLIQVFDRYRNLKALYSFFSLGAVNWRMDDLDASSGGILCEEFTIAHTGLVKLPVNPAHPLINSVMNLVSDVKTLFNASSAESRAEEAKKRREAAEELKKKKAEELELLRSKQQEERELEKEKREQQRLEEELAKQQKEEENKKAAEERRKERERQRLEEELAKQQKEEENEKTEEERENENAEE